MRDYMTNEEIIRKVLSAIAQSRKVKYEDTLSFEEGKLYDIYTDIELVGAYIEENEIRIIGRIKESTIHEDIIESESVNKSLCDEVMASILKAEPRLNGMVKLAPSVNRIRVLLYEKQDWLGDASFEYSYE